jgi:uncharacterized protein YjbI with pentapeptide repeats
MPARGKPRIADPQEPVLAPSLREVEHAALAAGDAWEEERVVGADLTASTAKSFRVMGCELVRVACTGARFELLALTDVVLTDCELSGAVLTKASLRRVELRNCRLSGVVLADAQLRDVRFISCKLDGANFRFSGATHVVFDDCSLPEADFSSAQLDAVAFDRCDLRGSEFASTSTTDTSLQGSTIDGLRGAGTLTGITIDSTQVVPFAVSMFAERGIAVDDGPD